MTSSFRLETDVRGLAVVTFDAPGKKVNLWSRTALAEFDALLDELAGRGDLTGVVFRSGKPDTFIAGADVAELADIDSPDEARELSRRGQAVFQRVTDLSLPVVAAIHGACVGGGLEFALACSFRVASDADQTRLGFPEVQLGIIPAWGGTQRAARLLSLEDALTLVLTGNRVPAKKALRMGLVDRVVQQERLDEEAAAMARAAAGGERAATQGRAGISNWLLKRNPVGRRVVLSQARRRVEQRSGYNYPAPFKAIEAIEVGLSQGMSAGLALEAEAVAELAGGPTARNLMRIHQLREAARRPPVAAEPRPVRTLGILGAGVMGGGIAEVASYSGIRVRLKDVDLGRVADGLEHAARIAGNAARKGSLDRRGVRDLMHRISGTVGYAGFGRVDAVVEAIVEDIEVKRRVLAEVEHEVRAGTVLATNTSSLRVDDLATALSRPEDFGGLHFFNPVERMPLVEVVRGARTSDGAVATLHQLALDLGKTPVVVNDGPGFWVNRLLMPYLNEAVHLYAEGVPIDALDGALEDFGLPMGPLALLDEIGLDVAAKVGKVMADAFPDRMRPHAILHRLQVTERLGRKSGAGFYRYEGGERKGPDEKLRGELGLPPTGEGQTPVYDDDYLATRTLYPMINEAARALADGIVSTPGEGDLALVMGIGWPPFRGGLLRWADEIGPAEVVERLGQWSALLDPRFAPSAALRERARGGSGFYGEPSSSVARAAVREDGQATLGI
ncbi:MAG TPA: 3-hydroxyacyl-CoA dehydrogenase NAD-binding domain-containing protein [Gemmatimonadota bacterium]|nr:3-hydroxyacyl-CoA dehydrogenase NAD-binding domain-containing protein [Gemmatimonadota bacterium]